jgi:hypothetical protein
MALSYNTLGVCITLYYFIYVRVEIILCAVLGWPGILFRDAKNNQIALRTLNFIFTNHVSWSQIS